MVKTEESGAGARKEQEKEVSVEVEVGAEEGEIVIALGTGTGSDEVGHQKKTDKADVAKVAAEVGAEIEIALVTGGTEMATAAAAAMTGTKCLRQLTKTACIC
mmetsp:Transcript_46913/g.92341  ORF Transcript_46913/g.92341 Transcript_46913/m.92341 type:complete len:103 (-) Transcript_46913:1032-1340(-)